MEFIQTTCGPLQTVHSHKCHPLAPLKGKDVSNKSANGVIVLLREYKNLAARFLFSRSPPSNALFLRALIVVSIFRFFSESFNIRPIVSAFLLNTVFTLEHPGTRVAGQDNIRGYKARRYVVIKQFKSTQKRANAHAVSPRRQAEMSQTARDKRRRRQTMTNSTLYFACLLLFWH